MCTLQRNSPTNHIVAPCVNPKELCTSCSTVMPSDICFDCGKLSKFLVAYPELEASIEANQENTGPKNSCFTNSHKRYTRLRRARKLEYRANKHLIKSNTMSWQFNLDGGLRDEEVHDISKLPAQDITDSQEYFGIQTEDIHVYYDVWEDLAQDESALLDDDLNLHYLGRNLMESLDMAADNQFETNDADDEDSEYGDSEGSLAPNSFIVKMAQRCTTLQWEPSLPVERISRKAQGLYNHLCGWNFADATSCARTRVGFVEDDEISPLDSARKFSFDDGYDELDCGFLDSRDGDGYCSDSSSATVRNQVVECRRVVGGLAYEWNILL